jgi:hypothetical protein
MHYVNYSKTPFFDKLNELQGTPDPTKISPADFSAARKALFTEKGVKEKLSIKSLIATQPVVNSEKVSRNVAEGKNKRLFIVRYGGKNFVMDGHHALAGAAARGDKKIKARVIEISNAPRITQEFDAESGKSQARDQGGKFTNEGKGSQQSGYKHPSDEADAAKAADKAIGEKPMTRKPLSAKTREQSRIGESKARGNSPTVSPEQYDILREQGKAYIAKMRSGPGDTSGMDANWEAIKGHAYEESQKDWGGVTIDPRTGADFKPPKQESGPYAISVRNPGQDTISIPSNATREQFDAAMEQAKASYSQLGAKDHYLGVFHDNDKGTIDFDPVLIVNTPAQVEAVGAYTKSIGGAYDFATGNGYFPPHVKGISTTKNPQRIELKRTLGSEGVSSVEEDEALSHTSEVKFITFANGKRGVFKPESGASAAGRDWISGNLIHREVASGELAEILGMDDLVPASVIRDIDGEEGSMQEMVENATTARRVYSDEEKFDGEHDLARAAAFDYVIYNTDRHDNNWMVEKKEGSSKLRLIDNGLSFPTQQGGFANHQLFDEAQSRSLDVPEEVREWQGKWPEIEKVLTAHGMDEEQTGGVRRRLMELANSATFNDLPEWDEGNRNYDREPSRISADEWTPDSESSETTERTPAAVGGSRGTLETDSKIRQPHAGRYPVSKELTGPNPSIHASEYVDPHGGIHERKGPPTTWEKDYDLFLKHQHGKVAVQDAASGGWKYETAKPTLGTKENPKLPGLETGNSSDWKPLPNESSKEYPSRPHPSKVLPGMIMDEYNVIHAKRDIGMAQEAEWSELNEDAKAEVRKAMHNERVRRGYPFSPKPKPGDQPLIHQSEIMDEKGIIHKKADVNMADSANWNDMNDVGKAEVRARMAEQRKKRGIKE